MGPTDPSSIVPIDTFLDIRDVLPMYLIFCNQAICLNSFDESRECIRRAGKKVTITDAPLRFSGTAWIVPLI
jgi:hypothetical protein